CARTSAVHGRTDARPRGRISASGPASRAGHARRRRGVPGGLRGVARGTRQRGRPRRPRAARGLSLGAPALDEGFDGTELDRSVWLPHYLPAWSSLADSAADHEVRDSRLALRIRPDQALWCPDTHAEPLRVSGIMSGNHSGPVGSSRAPQPFLDGQLVREAQERFEGWLQSNGHVEITCPIALAPRSMAALWLAGWEEDPVESGELCVFEIFGRSMRAGPSAEVGMGVKQLRDPRLVHDFDAPPLPIDVARHHTYAVDWAADEAPFSADGKVVRRCRRPPTYPMQLMVAVFDFP